MSKANKQPMSGPSDVFDPVTHEPRSGQSALAGTVMGNSTATLPMKFNFDSKDHGHTVIFAPTGTGMPVDYSVFGLSNAEVAAAKIVDRG